jgi:hypothetical protein
MAINIIFRNTNILIQHPGFVLVLIFFKFFNEDKECFTKSHKYYDQSRTGA